MITIIKIFWIFCCFNLALLFITSKNNKTIAHLMLATLVANIAFPLYVDLNKEFSIYVTSMAIVLVLYNLIITVYDRNFIEADYYVDVSKEMNIIAASMVVIYALTAFQLLVLKIYVYETYAYIFSTYMVVQLIILFFYNIRNKFDREAIITLVSIISLGNSLLGIYEALVLGVYRVGGLVGYSNGAGSLGAILFPVLLYKLWKKRSIYNFVVLALNLVFTYYTFTRVGYFAIFIETFIFIVFLAFRSSDQGKILKKIFYVTISAAIMFFVYNFYVDDIIGTYNKLFSYRGSTQSLRFIQFKRAFEIFLESPFIGIGTGQYPSYILMNHFIADIDIHSHWLNILVEQGIMTFIFYAVFLVALFRMMLKRCKGEDMWFAIAMFIGNALAVNFNPSQYYGINIYIFYFIVCGYIFARDSK